MTKRVLGRGLEALLSAHPAEAEPSRSRSEDQIPIEKIVTNEEQPRRRFDPAKIQELADSVRAKGQEGFLREGPSRATMSSGKSAAILSERAADTSTRREPERTPGRGLLSRRLWP